MNSFTYSVVRSFNQYMAGALGTANLTASGSTASLVLNAYPPYKDMSGDTVTCYVFDEVIKEVGGGRMASGTKSRIGNFAFQVDVWSPPNANSEPRQGANRQFKDAVEQALKPKVRINLVDYSGTAGTSVAGGMFIRQEDARWMPDENLPGWSRWRLGYRLKAVDSD